MDRMRKIIVLLIILIIFIIICILLMLLSTKLTNNVSNNINTNIISGDNNSFIGDNKENIYYNSTEYEILTETEKTKELRYVTNRSQYFTVKELIKSYNSLAEQGNYYVLVKILGKPYLKEFEINENNIYGELNIQMLGEGEEYSIIINEMLTTQIDEYVNIYLVKGKSRYHNNKSDFCIMLEQDAKNGTYAIYPNKYVEQKGYSNLKEGDKITFVSQGVMQNGYNKFTSVIKTNEEVAVAYFEDYIELINYYKDEAYNKLDKEYASKRFGSLDAFAQYLLNNKEKFLEIKIDKYKVISEGNYTDYICADQYENLYIFRQQNGIMRYTAFLDNYTVMLEEYEKEYNKLDKVDRSKYNLTKFINMVNTQDYSAIYNVLDKTFKDNNFKSQLQLEEFIKNNMYFLNRLEIENADVETYEYCIFECKIINLKDTKESKKMTIIINQKEGVDFTMSFSLVQEK